MLILAVPKVLEVLRDRLFSCDGMSALSRTAELQEGAGVPSRLGTLDVTGSGDVVAL